MKDSNQCRATQHHPLLPNLPFAGVTQVMVLLQMESSTCFSCLQDDAGHGIAHLVLRKQGGGPVSGKGGVLLP